MSITKCCSWLFALVGLVAVGCSHTTTYGRKLENDSIKQIRIGKTTKSEVVQLVGNPPERQVKGETEAWSYGYLESGGAVNPVTFIPVVGLFAGGAKSSGISQTLIIEFKNDVVSQCTYKRTSSTGNVSMGGFKNDHNDPGTSITTDCEKAE